MDSNFISSLIALARKPDHDQSHIVFLNDADKVDTISPEWEFCGREDEKDGKNAFCRKVSTYIESINYIKAPEVISAKSKVLIHLNKREISVGQLKPFLDVLTKPELALSIMDKESKLFVFTHQDYKPLFIEQLAKTPEMALKIISGEQEAIKKFRKLAVPLVQKRRQELKAKQFGQAGAAKKTASSGINLPYNRKPELSRTPVVPTVVPKPVSSKVEGLRKYPEKSIAVSSNERLRPKPVSRLSQIKTPLIPAKTVFTPLNIKRPPVSTSVASTLPSSTQQTRRNSPAYGARPKQPQTDKRHDKVQKVSKLLVELALGESVISRCVECINQNKSAFELFNILHHKLGLDWEKSVKVVQCAKPPELNLWRARLHAKKRLVANPSAEVSRERTERFTKFKSRNISDPQVEILAIGSCLDDRTGNTFDPGRTAFANLWPTLERGPSGGEAMTQVSRDALGKPSVSIASQPTQGSDRYSKEDVSEQDIVQIATHLRDMNIEEETIVNLQQVLRKLPVSINTIKNARLGISSDLSDLLTAFVLFQPEKPQTLPPQTKHNQSVSADRRHIDPPNDVINGAAAIWAGNWQHGVQRRFVVKDEVLQNQWREDGFGLMDSDQWEESEKFDSFNIYAVFNSKPRREAMIEKLNHYFQGRSLSITIDKKLLNEFIHQNKVKLCADYFLAASGNENCVKSVAELYEQWWEDNYGVNSKSTKSPLMINAGSRQSRVGNALADFQREPVFNLSAGQQENLSAISNFISERKKSSGHCVKSFMWARDKTDGAMAFGPVFRPEYAGVPAENLYAQYHEQAFRNGLVKAIKVDKTLTKADTISLQNDLDAMYEIDKVRVQKLAAEKSYPKAGFSHGAVSVKQAAGIQAADNNCAIASVLMGMSYKGGLSSLTAQINESLEKAKMPIKMLKTDTADKDANRENRKTLEAFNRLGRAVQVLVQYDSKQIESIRANDDLDDIRKIYNLVEGKYLDVDECFDQLITDLRTLQSFTKCSKRIEIFNFPVDKRAELQGMSIAGAFEKFYLTTVAENTGSRLEDTDILILAPPTYGVNERMDMDLSPEVEKYDSHGDLIKYQLVASVNIAGAHYVTFLRDDEKGLLYLADSMGMSFKTSHSQQVTVPTITSMPMNGTEKALDDAIEKAGNRSLDGHDMRITKARWEGLNKNCRFAIYQRKNNH